MPYGTYDILVKEDTGTYNDLASAVSAANASDVIEIQDAWDNVDSGGAFTIDVEGLVIQIDPTDAAHHPGHCNGGGTPTHHRINITGASHAVEIDAVSCTLDGLDISVDTSNSSQECVRINNSVSVTTTRSVTIKNCLIGMWQVTTQQDCIYINNCDDTPYDLYLTNCVLYNPARSAAGAYGCDADVKVYVNSCTEYKTASFSGDTNQERRKGPFGVSHCAGVTISFFNSLLTQENILTETASDEWITVGVGTYTYDHARIDRCIINKSEAQSDGILTHDDNDYSKTFDDADTSGQVIFRNVDGNPETWDLRLYDNDTNNIAQTNHSDSSSADTTMTMPSVDMLGTTRSASYDVGAFAFSTGVDLTVGDITSTTHVDAISVEQEHNLSISDVTAQGHIDALSLSQEHNLSVSGVTSTAHIGDFALVQDKALTVADITSATHISEMSLVQEYALSVSDITAITDIDDLAFSQELTLSVSDITTATNIDALSLIQEHNLTISSATSQAYIDSVILDVPGIYFVVAQPITATTHISEIDLRQGVALVVPGITSATHIDGIVLGGTTSLVIADITATTHISAIELAQEHNLTISDITQINYIDSLSLAQEHVLSVSGVLSQAHIDALTLSYTHVLTPGEIVAVTTVDVISLVQAHYLTIYGIALPTHIEDINLSYSGNIFLNDVIKPYLETKTKRREIRRITA